MNFLGRIILLSVVWVTFVGSIVYLEIINTALHYEIAVLALIIYTIAGWFGGRHYDRMRYYSTRDVLTDTYNRRYVHHIFPKLKARARRREQRLIVYIVDVDDFKEINDEYGHAVGDMVLLSISSILNGLKGEDDIVARWGGDEFIMIAFCTELSLAILDTFSIETGISELHNKLNNKITVSIGKSIYPDDADDLELLLKIADDNMYELKQTHDYVI